MDQTNYMQQCQYNVDQFFKLIKQNLYSTEGNNLEI